MMRQSDRWLTAAGVILISISLVLLLRYGLVIWSYLLLGFLPEVIRGDTNIVEWLVLLYGIEILMLLITGLGIVRRANWWKRIAVMTLILTYYAAEIWISVGDWPYEKLISRGSAQPALMFGQYLLREGDYVSPQYQIDPTRWLVMSFVLASALVITLLLLAKYRVRIAA